MVGKDEQQQQLEVEGLARVKLIADKKRLLEETAKLVQDRIRNSFERLSLGLREREKQLLRQVEAVNRQQLSLVQSSSEHLVPGDDDVDLKVDLSSESELLERLASFGRLNLSSALAASNSEPYKAEEYLEASEDVVSFDKSLKTEVDEFDVSSVIRRRKRGGATAAEPIASINLNCTNCRAASSNIHDSQEVEATTTNNLASGSDTKKFDDSPASPDSRSNSSCSYDYDKCIIKKNEDESSSEDEEMDNDLPERMEKFSIEDDSSNGNCVVPKSLVNDNSAPVKSQDDPTEGNPEHPIQIQQWLKQILAETETEPIMHEFGQIISKIPPPKPRLYRDISAVET